RGGRSPLFGAMATSIGYRSGTVNGRAVRGAGLAPVAAGSDTGAAVVVDPAPSEPVHATAIRAAAARSETRMNRDRARMGGHATVRDPPLMGWGRAPGPGSARATSRTPCRGSRGPSPPRAPWVARPATRRSAGRDARRPGTDPRSA